MTQEYLTVLPSSRSVFTTMRSIASASVLSVFATACGTYATFTPLHVPPHPLSPKAAACVDLIVDNMPRRPAALVGVLSSGEASSFSAASREDALQALRAKGGEVGCDAVLVTDEHTEAFHYWVTTSQYRVGDWEYTQRELNERDLHHFHGSCLVYVEATGR